MSLPGEIVSMSFSGGLSITASRITGTASVSRQENQTATMSMQFIDETGQNFSSASGSAAIFSVNGSTVFTGLIDYVTSDRKTKTATVFCTDDRRGLINAMDVSAIGFYSDAIFNNAEDTNQELEQRLQTTPKTVDVNSSGAIVVSDYLTGNGSVSFSDADVLRRPYVSSSLNRARVINDFTITAEYRYTRLRHRERAYQIPDLDFCDILDLGAAGKFTKKTSFLTYADAQTWNMNESSIVWEEMPATGDTPCFINLFYVSDDRFATKMSYNAALRFSQTIREIYTITVKDAGSISEFGSLHKKISYGLVADDNTNEWESNKTYTATPLDFNFTSLDNYKDDDSNSADLSHMLNVAINIAATEIKKSLRSASVSFQAFFNASLEVSKGGSVNSGGYSGSGKITAIEHSFNVKNRFATSTVTLGIYHGSPSSASFVAPPRPTVPLVGDIYIDPVVMPIADNQIVSPGIDDLSRDEQMVAVLSDYLL